MKKVLLFGEAPNDTSSIASLMRLRYEEDASFGNLVEDINQEQIKNEFKGGVLLTKDKPLKSKLRRLINTSYRIKKPDLIIFVIDLDSLENDREKKIGRQEIFNRYNTQVEDKGILLLNIFELEALLLADIKVVNDFYKIEMTYDGDPMLQVDPKGHIKKYCKYEEAHSPELFSKLNFDNVIKVRYFQKFITEFEQKLKSA